MNCIYIYLTLQDICKTIKGHFRDIILNNMAQLPIWESNDDFIYTFLDYEVHPHHREIYQRGNKLKLSKKSFDILLLLLQLQHQKPGRVVTKQNLIDTVWPNQIVTDAALNKQIARLRSDLVSNKSNEPLIIETVRGIGVRLVIAIQAKQKKPTNNKPKLKIALALVSMLALIIYLSVNIFTASPVADDILIEEQKTKAINIALVPAKKSLDWLNIGGLNYLSDQLHQHAEIQTISPRSKWFSNDDNQSLAIELSQTDGIDYVLSVNNLQKGKQYITDIALRNNDGILAKKIIKAASLSLLFEKINSWTIRQLDISDAINKGKVFGYQPTDFALESYLRGLEIARNNSYEKAIHFLQIAIDEDKTFFSAGLLLAEIEAELGNYQKATALLDSMDELDNFDLSLKNRLYDIKAVVLLYQNKLDEAQMYLDKSMHLSEQKNDMKALIRSLTTQAMILFSANEIDKQIVTVLQKQLKLIKDHNPDPYFIALSSLNISVAYQATGQYDLAISHINDAIDIYTRANNIIGIVSANSILADMYFEIGETGKGLRTLEKADHLYKQIDGIHDHMIYLKSKVKNQAYHGLKKQALASISQLEELGTVHSNPEALVMALSLGAELNILYKDFASAQTNIEKLLKIIKTSPQEIISGYNSLIIIDDMQITALTEPPVQARKSINNHLNLHPQLKLHNNSQLQLIEAIILNKEGAHTKSAKLMHELMNDHLKVNRIQQGINIGYKILDIQWHNDIQDYVKTMNHLSELATFKYPILKYKAQYLAANNDYINAYVMMMQLKGKANQFWTTKDQILLEEYQQQAKGLQFKQ